MSVNCARIGICSLVELFKSFLLRDTRRIDESYDTCLAQSHTCTVRCDWFSNYHGFIRACVTGDFVVAYHIGHLKSAASNIINQFFVAKRFKNQFPRNFIKLKIWIFNS